MPSPAFRINGGAVGAPASVAAGATVTATVDSTDGVRSCAWSVVSTDESTSYTDYTLVQSGSVGQTVTLTAGDEGTAGILRCEINGGIDLQTEQPSAATRATGKWFVPAPNGLEVGCVNEQYESNAQFGWTHIVNDIVRTADVVPPADEAVAEDVDEDDTICLIGTSIVAGDSASSDGATGFREPLFQILRERRSRFRLVGPHAYGALNGTGQTWGRFYSPEDYHDPHAPPMIGYWDHHGESGRKLSASFTATSVDTVADTITAPGHDLGNGSLLALTSTGTIPTVSTVQAFYFATNVVAGVSFQLAALEGGAVLDITAAGSGTITVGTGLAQLAAATFPVFQPQTVIGHGGTNDISERVDAGDSAAAALAACQARATAWMSAMEAGAPLAKRFLITSLMSFFDPVSNLATKQQVVADFNAWLATYVPSRGRKWAYVDAAAGITAAHMQADGIHQRRPGSRLLAENIAAGYFAATGWREVGKPVPRPFRKRRSQACLQLSSTTHVVTIPDQASIRAGGDNAAWAIWYRPSSVSGGPNVILQQNSTYTNGFLLAQSGNSVILYFRQGGASIPVGPYNAVLKKDYWHRIFVVVDHDTNQVGLFVNGRLCQIANITDNTISTQQPLYIGSIGGLNAALGHYAGLVFAKGSAISMAHALEMAEADYYDGQDPPGVSAKYNLDDGTGTAVVGTVYGSTNGTITGATWTAAGAVPRPCDDAFLGPGALIEFQRNVTPVIRQVDETTNSVSGRTLLIQGQPATGTSSTGGSVDIRSGSGVAAAGSVTLRANAAIRVEASATGLGFFANVPIARPAAYTQIYATANRTLAAYTSDGENIAYTGIDNAQAGTVYATVADVNQLRAAYENLRVAAESTMQVLNQVIDDLQAYGLLQ